MESICHVNMDMNMTVTIGQTGMKRPRGTGYYAYLAES